MNISKVNEALNHSIVGGSEYNWRCYGHNVRFLDYESEHAHASVLFDTLTREVYEAIISHKEDKVKPYRWLNPEYKQKYFDEAKNKGVDPYKAWDDVNWVDLEVEEDFLSKANAIFNGFAFDERVQVPVELKQHELYHLMKMAHERDLTLNKMVELLLWETINSEKNRNN